MKKILFFGAALLSLGGIRAQVSGVVTVPGTYTSIGAAINDLNTQGISGNVIVDVQAGYTETAPAGGYTLTATGNSTSSITFQKSGVGSNPLITAFVGSLTPSSAQQDGVWRLIGSDYITIDGIDITDPNITNPATMEFGYGFFKASTTDGCQNNTIRNCNITLSFLNNASGSGPSVDGSRGIDMVNALTGAHITAVTVASAAGTNSNNKFYKNTISNCNVGIALIGYAASSPFTNADQNNDIGGLSAATSNTIVNFGGASGATNPAAGIRTLAQYGLNVSYNVLVNNNGSGVNHPNTLRGIYLNTATSANATVNANTLTINGGGTTSQVAVIENASGSTASSNTIAITNNLIQNCNYSTATSGTFLGILNSGTPAMINISGNLITNNVLPGTGTFTGIDGGGTSGILVSLVNNTLTLNTKTGASGTFYCMRAGTASVTVNGNTISNNSIPNTSGTSSSALYGFYDAASPTFEVYTNNLINNLIISGSSTSTGHTIYGLHSNTSSSSVKTYSGNIINTLSIAGSLSGGTVYGLYHSLTGTTNIYKNKIYDLNANGASGFAYGYYINSGGTVNLYNNLVGSLTAPQASGANVIAGIFINGGTTINASYNTVYLNATSTGANFGTSALYASTSPNLTLRNNILVNTSTANGTGLTASYRRSSTTLTSYNAASNNNLFYAGTPGTSNVIFTDGTASQQTLVAYKTLVSTRDNLSVTENPPFISLSGSTPNFLNLNTATATQIESGGTPVSGITDDYTGTVRNVTTPDIGAWEGTYTPAAEMIPPIVVSSGFTTTTCNLTTRTFTANLSDLSGVASGSVAPRVYYKVNNGAYTSVAGTMISGSATNGVWSFVLTYAASNFDVISYYLVAQDIMATPNLVASPSAGFSGTDVNNITTPPTTPNTYTIANLNGVYTVGTAGTFTSLTQAAAMYNIACITGPVTYSLINSSYSTSETFPIVFMNNPDASSTNSLLITPAAGSSVSVIGSTGAAAVVKFLNARYITLNGSNSGSALTFSNSNTGASAVMWLASSSSTGPGNSNISIQNITAIGGGTTSSSGFGIVAGVDGATPSTTGGMDNDNITIQGNSIVRAYYGIYANGTASVTAGGLNAWTISTNSVGPVTSGTNNIGFAGIYLSNMVSPMISSNVVRNIVTSSNTNGGIYLLSNISAPVVTQNTVTNVSTSSTGSGITSISGIFIGSGVTNATISRNVVSTVINSSTGGWGARGIMLATNVTGGTYNVENNMVSDIRSYSDASNIYHPIGIALEGTTGGVNLQYNTVDLSGSFPGLTGATGSEALYINSTGGGFVIRNNIFSNTYNNSSSTTDANYAVYSSVPNTNFTTMNYNNYYVGGTGNVPTLGYIGGAAQTSFAAFQSSFGQNANSLNIQPVYTSATDLHLVPANNVSLDNVGTPVGTITIDIDNQVRNATTPDMGADEYTSPVCTGANGGTIAVATLSACAGQTLGMISNGVSTGVNTVYQWKVATVSGGPYSNVTGGTGANTATYTTGSLAAGTFYYVLEVQCTSAATTSISNEVTVTVSGLPSISVSPTTGTICMPGGTAMALTASGGNSYTWTPTTGLTGSGSVVNALPAATTVYTVTGDNASGCTAKASTTVSVAEYPIVNSITATPSVVCANGSSTLQAAATLTSYIVTGIPYAPISTPGTGVTVLANNGSAVTPLTSGSLDDGGWANQTIPFSFQLFGTSYTSFAVSTNGFIYLGTGTPSTFSGYNNVWPSTSPAKPAVGVVYSDLDFDGVGSNSNINYFVTGTSPNQKLVVNWTGQFWSNTGTLTAQAILYESTNVIEVHTFSSTAVNNAVQGLLNTSGNAAYVAPGRNNTLWPVTTPDAYRWTPTPLSYSWSPSSFLSSTSVSNPVASNVTSATLYSVAISSPNGCTTGTTVSLSIDIPTVSITSGGTVCAGTTVTLTASGASSYSWNTGSTSASITESPTLTTTYVVTGTNAATGCTATASESVAVNSLPVVSISSPSAICSGATATLTASGAVSYSWNTSAITASITDSPTSTTSYTVTGTDANNCSAAVSATVNVNSLPTVVISGTSTVCYGNSVNLTASGATTYSWDNGSTTANITPTPTGNVTYTVTGTDNNNCINTATQAITVNPNPTVTVSGGTMCPGDSFTLSPSGAVTYTYLPGGPVVSPGSTTTYTVMGESASGCISQTAATAVVTVTNSLNVTITGSTTICSGQALNLVANGATTYSWNTGANTQSISPSPTSNTTYSVLGTSGSCSSTAVVTVTVNALPSLTLSAASATACTNGPTVSLTGSPAGGVYSGSNVSGSVFTPPATAGTFNAVYSYTDNSTGCSNTASTGIVVSICTDISKIGSTLKGLAVYPNPNIGEFTIELNTKDVKTVEIADATGRVVMTSSSSDEKMNMNIKSLANGIYFVKVQSGSNVEVIKIVKQ